jgi:hypothetical protein
LLQTTNSQERLCQLYGSSVLRQLGVTGVHGSDPKPGRSGILRVADHTSNRSSKRYAVTQE